MTIYWICYDTLSIKHETYCVGNLMAFYEEMDEVRPDGWWDNLEDAEEELKDLSDLSDPEELIMYTFK